MTDVLDRNTRANRNITFDGRTQPLAAWVEELGIRHTTLIQRFNRGWSVERAFTTPLRT